MSAQPSFPDNTTVREAREAYFRHNGFGDGGYTRRWVPVRLGPLTLPLLNTQTRVRAVRLHDLHHVATGYQTDLVGEGEIAAWELAAGCRGYLAAWALNSVAVAIGFCLAPRRMRAAWIRGRSSRSLYAEGWRESLLQLELGALRSLLGLEGDRPSPMAPVSE